MIDKNYAGYPSYVVVALPKSGTKTMNKCFSSLGYKVFDAAQMPAFAKQFDDYGKRKITFAQMAKIWEKNKYDVIIEPAALYWYETAQHWPKTKFIQLTRDPVAWEKSVTNFLKSLCQVPRGSVLRHFLYNSPFLSPTAYHGIRNSITPYLRYSIGYPSPMDQSVHPTETLEMAEPWIAMVQRKLRIFHADVTLHAPKDRTLYNYEVKDGWTKLREFLELPEDFDQPFPHVNKATNTCDFIMNLYNETGTDYETKVDQEMADFMRQHGFELKRIKET